MSSGTSRRERHDHPRLPADQPVWRPALLGVLAGTALLVTGLMLVYLVIREVAVEYGGACSSGGPYEIRPGQECRPGAFTSVYVSIAVVVAGALLLLWCAKRYGGGLVVNSTMGIVGSLFFGGLGVSFLEVADEMSPGADGVSDFKGVGVTFLVLAVLALGMAFVAARYGPRFGRNDFPQSPRRDWLAWLAAILAGAVVGGVVGTLLVQAS